MQNSLVSAMVWLREEYTSNSGGFTLSKLRGYKQHGRNLEPHLEQMNSWVSNLEKKELGVNLCDSYLN